jgi:hypothetical protein
MKDLRGRTSTAGTNPFALGWTKGGRNLDLSKVPVYDWVRDDGYTNLGLWVASAYVVR